MVAPLPPPAPMMPAPALHQRLTQSDISGMIGVAAGVLSLIALLQDILMTIHAFVADEIP